MKENKQRIVYVSVNQLRVASFNPPARTTPQAIAELRADIEENGIKAPLHAIPSGSLADGHRRFACALSLGIDKVPVTYHEGKSEKDLPALWAELNKFTRKTEPADWLHVWFHATPSCDLKSELLPRNIMRNVVDSWEVFGKAGIETLVLAKYSPLAGRRVKDVVRWVDSFDRLKGQITTKMMGAWVLRHGRSSLTGVSFAHRAGILGGRGGLGFAKRIVAAVKGDKPLTESSLRMRLATKNAARSREKIGDDGDE